MSSQGQNIDSTLSQLMNVQKTTLAEVGLNTHSAVRNYFDAQHKMAYYEPLQHLLSQNKTTNEVVIQYAELSLKLSKVMAARKEFDNNEIKGKNIFLELIDNNESITHLMKAVTIDKFKMVLQQAKKIEQNALVQQGIISKKIIPYENALNTMKTHNQKVAEITGDVLRYFFVVEMSLDTRKSLIADFEYLLKQVKIEIEYIEKQIKSHETGVLLRSIPTSVQTLKDKKSLPFNISMLNTGLIGSKIFLQLLTTIGVAHIIHYIYSLLPYSSLIQLILVFFCLIAVFVLALLEKRTLIMPMSLVVTGGVYCILLATTTHIIPMLILTIISGLLTYATSKLVKQSKQLNYQTKRVYNLVNNIGQ